MENQVKLLCFIIFFAFGFESKAERVKVSEIMIVGSNVQYVFNFKNKKYKIYYAKAGFQSEIGETSMGILNKKKYRKEKIKSIWFETKDEQLYLTLKKSGKTRLLDLELLVKTWLRNSVIAAYTGIALDAASMFFVFNGLFEDSNAQVGIGIGLFAISTIPWATFFYGEFTNLELSTCDIFYKVEGETEYILFQKAPKEAGTFPHSPNIKIK